MKLIKIKINSDGSKVDVEAEGFQGSGCVNTTEHMIRALGMTNDSKLKSEYYVELEEEVNLNV